MSDLISRQAAIDAVAEGLKDTFVEYQDIAEKMIGKLPSAQPERKTGKWYKPTGMMPPEYTGQYRCTVCDSLAMRDWKHHRQELTNFCPNCGADMRGEANAENMDEDQ